MLVSGESEYISSKQGVKKDGEEWFMVKFLDEEADSFFTAFVEAELYNKVKNLPKHTPVLLSLNLVPGEKYFSLETLEVIE